MAPYTHIRSIDVTKSAAVMLGFVNLHCFLMRWY